MRHLRWQRNILNDFTYEKKDDIILALERPGFQTADCVYISGAMYIHIQLFVEVYFLRLRATHVVFHSSGSIVDP